MTTDLPSLHRAMRSTRPRTRRHLWDYLVNFTGLSIAHAKVCPHHTPPFELLAEQFFDRPAQALWHGPRGAGKSLLSALDAHLVSQFSPGHGTRILGGSYQQSRQIYEAIRDYCLHGAGPMGTCGDSIEKLLERETVYRNGSRIAVLAASSTSVRGPHVPSLRLDEVDEIKSDLREQAMGMAMEQRGYPVSVLMTSTWHKAAGPMAEMMARGKAGQFPVRSFCIFDVLQRCPESRSGKYVGGREQYENCPACPIQKWCHEDLDITGKPKAKLADGHYTIDTLIQKVQGVGDRTFEADYLCREPRVEGTWFPSFTAANISEAAEYDPASPVLLAIDSGVHTGAVWLQVSDRVNRSGQMQTRVNVFADFYSEMGAGSTAYENAQRILAVGNERCSGRKDIITTDPAGRSRNEVGPTVVAEYERAGLRPLRHWGHHQVVDGLALIESFVRTADGSADLLVHPRCKHLIDSFKSYARAKVRGMWADYPADPQHPAEDLMDALRGGLMHRFPAGRRPEPALPKVPMRHVF